MIGSYHAERIVDRFAELCDSINARWTRRLRASFSMNTLHRAYEEVKRSRGGKIPLLAKDEAEFLARSMFKQDQLPPTGRGEL